MNALAKMSDRRYPRFAAYSQLGGKLDFDAWVRAGMPKGCA